MTATSRVSFQTGCWPPARSIMLNRRMPSASPGARGSPVRNPSSSGPRCRIAAAISRTRDSASLLREAKATPQIPHTLLLDLRSRKEGHPGAQGVLAQVEARNSQTAIGVPRQYRSQQQEEKRHANGNNEDKKRLPLKQQAPIHGLVPSRHRAVQHAAESHAIERQPRQTYVSEVVEIVLTRVARDRAYRFRKHTRISQLAPCQQLPMRIAKQNPVRRIDNDPAPSD